MCSRKFVEEAHKAFARVEEYADVSDLFSCMKLHFNTSLLHMIS